MTSYTVDAFGDTTPATPAFPQPIINDQLLPDGSFDTTMTTAQVFVDGTYTLQSLFLGAAIELDLGEFSGITLTGTGNVTGSNDTTQLLPALVNDFGTVDINGGIYVPFTNYGQLTVSAGERLILGGDFSGQSASAAAVAAGAELDVNSLNSALVSALTSQGTLKFTAPNSLVSGATTLGGTVLVQGDATNGAGTGVQIARTINANGAYVATLDLRQATLATPITNLTLGTDAQIRFGTATTTIGRFVVAGSATALVPLDVVSADGNVNITGSGTGAANQVAISEAELTGGHIIDFNVAAPAGGATLRQVVAVDAGTTLRNDASMTIGGTGTTAATIGATAAASGSSFINGTSGQLTIAAGAALSVAAIQNAGAINVAGNATVLQPFTNTGTVDVTAGTLSIETAIQGAGTLSVENGATLSIDAASSGGNVVLTSGGLLRLSQPASFAGTIQAPPIGARIDLAGTNAIAATMTNGSILVTTATGSFNLAETGTINGTTLALSSDGAGGTLLTVGTAASVTPTPAAPNPVVYRFFDDVHGTQFLTASLTESQTLQSTRPDLVFEGPGLNAVPSTSSTAAPVYRFFDSTFGTHFYTSSTTERDDILATRPDLVSEGIGFYEHTTQQTGDVAVYRFFESTNGTHFFTASATERATIIATRPDLVGEGIAFYAPSGTTTS